MYSGFILIFGLEISQEDVLKIFGIKPTDDLHRIIDITEELLEKKHGITLIELHKKPCCTHSKGDYIYLGVYLGKFSAQYRDNVSEYTDFGKFYTEIKNRLDKLKDNYNKDIRQINEEFNKLYERYPALRDIGVKTFYTLADDCDSCT